MKQYLILLAAVFLFSNARGQQLNSAEYFLDTDPGVGNGTALVVTTGDSILYSGNIPTGALPDGFHFIYIRAKDTNGKWGLRERRTFVIRTVVPASPQTAAEYFIDTDPGTGNGTSLTVTGNDSIVFNGSIPTTSLTTDFHFLYMRTKGIDGKWGMRERRMFYINNPPFNPPNLIAAEYFVNADPGFGNATPISITGGDSIVFTGPLAITDTASGPYNLYIRVKDLAGVWSLYEQRGFQIAPDASVNEINGNNQSALFQNYPNPFSNSTVIEFHLTKPGDVTVYISDLLGREVRKIEHKNLSPGNHSITLDNSALTEGYYLYRLVAGDFTATKKMTFAKR